MNLNKKKEREKQLCYSLSFKQFWTEFFPNDFAYLAEYYHVRRQLYKSILYYKKAIKQNPRDELSYRGLADVYEELKKYKESLICYKQAYAISPEKHILRQIARIYKIMGLEHYSRNNIRQANFCMKQGLKFYERIEKYKLEKFKFYTHRIRYILEKIKNREKL